MRKEERRPFEKDGWLVAFYASDSGSVTDYEKEESECTSIRALPHVKNTGQSRPIPVK